MANRATVHLCTVNEQTHALSSWQSHTLETRAGTVTLRPGDCDEQRVYDLG